MQCRFDCRALVVAAAMALLLVASGCQPSAAVNQSGSRADSMSPSDSLSLGRNVEGNLEAVFGERMGRSRVARSSVIVELSGTPTDADLFSAILALAASEPSEEALSATVLDRAASFTVLQWDTSTGRAVRMTGNGGEHYFHESPPGTTCACALTAFPAGRLDSLGLDGVRRYAADEPVPWQSELD